jgi:hypothetical protein
MGQWRTGGIWQTWEVKPEAGPEWCCMTWEFFIQPILLLEAFWDVGPGRAGEAFVHFIYRGSQLMMLERNSEHWNNLVI